MKNNRFFPALIMAGMALGACSSDKDKKLETDSATRSTSGVDTMGSDTADVKPADSTHSFRNDRGTDSVSAGKSIPAKP